MLKVRNEWVSSDELYLEYVLHLKDTTTSRECDEIIEVLEDRGLQTKKF